MHVCGSLSIQRPLLPRCREDGWYCHSAPGATIWLFETSAPTWSPWQQKQENQRERGAACS
jgi:hypothetical protein